ncbi:MAG: hypothetical protein AUI14_00215 [Actinobacteria bacterium 13_2_20CM_2_71_6]|nr:MAG: hypothetical protein AUI14_00215 [Actinobacteria bacterium 13_2_20CM_2_71_6]
MGPRSAASEGLSDAAVRGATESAVAVARDTAAAVDREASFPVAAFATLKESRLLGAAVPVALGGPGLAVSSLARIARSLGRACGATGMIWAMHQIQLGCLARGCVAGGPVADFLAEAATDQLLVASVTSERGVGGDLRTSVANVQPEGTGYRLEKDATVVSYGAYADGYLVTARRGPDAAPGDQVAVLARRLQVRLEQSSQWNPMGMRGTCSPGFRLRAIVPAGQILSVPFGELAATTMVPLSHVLWSAVWIGLASEAFERARQMLRARAGGHGLASGAERRLALADRLLTGLEVQLNDAADRYEPVYLGERAATTDLAVRMNALKVAASTATVEIAQYALEICGMAGYQEDGRFSMSRILRDLYSARLMIANDRLLDMNAVNLLLTKRE